MSGAPMPDARQRYQCIVITLCAASITACTVIGPHYTPSQPELPGDYHAPVPILFDGLHTHGPWWSMFNDTLLNALICRGINDNYDIRIALSRIREAQALARGVAAGTGPRLDGSLQARGQEQLDGDDDAEEGIALFSVLSGIWEIDLFGRLLRSREAAWARAGIEQALEIDTQRITVAEIVRQYVQMRAAERRLTLIHNAIELQTRTLSLVNNRVKAGLSPGLDTVRARAAVARLNAEVGPLQTEIQLTRNVLAVLIGGYPGELDQTLKMIDPQIPVAETGPALGVPAELLRRRPDIQAAEFRIAAATADVGVALGDLYPKLSLPGSITGGWDGIDEDSFVTSVIASLTALLELPLYDSGESDAAIDVAQERLIQQTLAYKQQLLFAMREVESALVGYAGAQSRYKALKETVRNNRLAFEQSGELYRQGFVSFLDVLDSQREWNITLQELTTAQRDLTLEIANLFSALGIDNRNLGCVPRL